MQIIRPIVAVATSLIFASAAWAADPVDHQAHHPAPGSASEKASKVQSGKASKPSTASMTAMKPSTKKMDDQLSMMRGMHEKMMSAKTPEERSALMEEHMKTMQGGMAMMGNMANMGADAPSKMKGDMQVDTGMCQMMEKRMEMMETMMQMMMDRMPAAAPVPAEK